MIAEVLAKALTLALAPTTRAILHACQLTQETNSLLRELILQGTGAAAQTQETPALAASSIPTPPGAASVTAALDASQELASASPIDPTTSTSGGPPGLPRKREATDVTFQTRTAEALRQSREARQALSTSLSGVRILPPHLQRR